METPEKYAYIVHCLVDYHGRSLPVERHLEADDDEAALKAFQSWCAAHPDGFEDNPYRQRPFLMKQRVLARS